MKSVKRQSTINQLPARHRPREKLKLVGPANLTTIELLALILSSGTHAQPVLKLATQLSNRYSLPDFDQLKRSQLITIKGIGQALSARILASVELGRRIFAESPLIKISQPQTVAQIAADLTYKQQEHTLALYLNGRQELIHRQTIAVGGVNYLMLEARDVFAPAFRLPASFIILVHNHPSGDPEPSQDDLKVTQRLLAAGELLGINLIDHIIVAKKGYVSLKEKGIIG